jgi:hypothetical protein
MECAVELCVNWSDDVAVACPCQAWGLTPSGLAAVPDEATVAEERLRSRDYDSWAAL